MSETPVWKAKPLVRDDSYVVVVKNAPFRVPVPPTDAVWRAKRQAQAALDQSRRVNEQRLLAALDKRIEEDNKLKEACSQQKEEKKKRSGFYNWHPPVNAPFACDLKAILEGDASEIVQLLDYRDPSRPADEQELSHLKDAAGTEVAALCTLFGSAEALMRLAFDYSNTRKALTFARYRKQPDVLAIVKAKTLEIWPWMAPELDDDDEDRADTKKEKKESEGSATEPPHASEADNVPKLSAACAAVLAHELARDGTRGGVWATLVERGSDDAIAQVLRCVCTRLRPPKSGECLNDLLAVAAPSPPSYARLARNMPPVATYLKALQATDAYWREWACEPRRSHGTASLIAALTPRANLIDVFGPAHDSFVLEGEDEDAWEARHKLFPDSNAYKRERAGRPSVCASIDAFRRNLDAFGQGQLRLLDWTNVMMLGGATVAALLAPSSDEGGEGEGEGQPAAAFGEGSDIDLCLYGPELLHDELARRNKVTEIYRAIVDAIPDVPVTVVTSGESISFYRHHPYRPVQIMGAFASPCEILSGIDLDCTAVGYDGRTVWCLPRARVAFNRRINVANGKESAVYGVRGCPHYEQRLLKYAARGFAIVDPALDRERVAADRILETEPDYDKEFSWRYTGDDEGQNCYPAVGLKLLLLCEKYPRMLAKVAGLKAYGSVPYGKDWPKERVERWLHVRGNASSWEPLPEGEETSDADHFNFFDGYTRYHHYPTLVRTENTLEPPPTPEPVVEGCGRIRRRNREALVEFDKALEELKLDASHAPFLVPNWLMGMDPKYKPRNRWGEDEDDAPDMDAGN